jgi:hypothetical protein
MDSSVSFLTLLTALRCESWPDGIFGKDKRRAEMHPTQETIYPHRLQRFFATKYLNLALGCVILPTMSQRHYAEARESYQQDMIAASIVDPQGYYDRCQLAKVRIFLAAGDAAETPPSLG